MLGLRPRLDNRSRDRGLIIDRYLVAKERNKYE